MTDSVSSTGDRANAPIARRRLFRFDSFEVDTAAHELRKNGVPIRLQEQPYQLLLVLLERRGEVVTREELRRRLWPASVFVDFDHGLNNSVARLREIFADSPQAPRIIATIPRVGYRFIADVVTDHLDPTAEAGEAAAVASGNTARPKSRRRRWLLAVFAGIVGTASALLWIEQREQLRVTEPDAKASLPDGPSLAVLPLVSRSPDPDDVQLAVGLTDAIMNRLATIRGMAVVARTSAFRVEPDQQSVIEIGRMLQATHVLRGNIERRDDRLQVLVDLYDARTGEAVWSRTFDRDAGDFQAIQEDIAFAVAAALKVRLLDADEFRIRHRGTRDSEAYRLYLIALPHLLGRTRSPDPAVAKMSLEAAAARDPQFAAAHAGLSRYYLSKASGSLTDIENSARLGIASADRAIALEPSSVESLLARAGFRFWRYRFRDDYAAYVSAQSDLQRALGMDPTNSIAYEDFGRAILWHEPTQAVTLLERAIETDPLCLGPNIMIASLLGLGGDLTAARARCAELQARYPGFSACVMAIGTLETYFGNFARALPLLRESEKRLGGAARIQLWSVHLSMGDRAGALSWLDFGRLPFERPLSDAARHAMDDRFEDAFVVLNTARADYPMSRLLDLPAAKFALIAGRDREALEILEERLPDLASGIEPITPRNVLPALDLATAMQLTGRTEQARKLVERVAAHLDGPSALKLPLFTFQRARAHALLGEYEAALAALVRAVDAGLRTTWALDLRPQSFLYIDPIVADPAFKELRNDARFTRWIERIETENARQFEVIRIANGGATAD